MSNSFQGTPFSRVLREGSLFALCATLGVFTFFGGEWSQQPADSPTLSVIVFVLLIAVMLWGAFSAVRHAEGLAHLLGEPYGTLILTLSVIVIEVAMIVALLMGGPSDPGVARDTMFSVLMIVLNGLVGLCLIVGGIRHSQQVFNLQGANAFLASLVVLGAVSLILPTLTNSKPGGEASTLMEVYLIIASVLAYGAFLFVQTGRYRGWFTSTDEEGDGKPHVPILNVKWHAILLVLHLLPIVLLAKKLAVFVDAGIHIAGLPAAFGGMVIAVIVLAPEAMVAIAAARHNRIQRSVNVCLGSGLATIGLTVPAVLIVGFITGITVELGLQPWNALLLGITFICSMLTFMSSRTNYMQGILHLVLFGAYLVLIFE